MAEAWGTIVEILYRATLLLALVYIVDIEMDGKLDLPHIYRKLGILDGVSITEYLWEE